MKRNWDVIRKILLKVEALPDEHSMVTSSDFEADAIDNENAVYHMDLLIQAGLIRGECHKVTAPAHCLLYSLTWDGHEFLDKIRRETIWNKIKETARIKGVDLTIDTVKAIASSILAQIVKGGNVG